MVIPKNKFMDILGKYPEINEFIRNSSFTLYNETTKAMMT